MGYRAEDLRRRGHLLPIRTSGTRSRATRSSRKACSASARSTACRWGIPFSTSPHQQHLVQQGRLREDGITVPTDWDSLVAACKTLKDNGSRRWTMPAALTGRSTISMLALIGTIGEDGYYALAAGKPAFDRPEFRDALDKYRNTLVSCYARIGAARPGPRLPTTSRTARLGMIMMGQSGPPTSRRTSARSRARVSTISRPRAPRPPPSSRWTCWPSLRARADVIAAAKHFLPPRPAPRADRIHMPKGGMAPNCTVDPSVYDYTVSHTAQQLAAAAKVDQVLPEPLLPPARPRSARSSASRSRSSPSIPRRRTRSPWCPRSRASARNSSPRTRSSTGDFDCCAGVGRSGTPHARWPHGAQESRNEEQRISVTHRPAPQRSQQCLLPGAADRALRRLLHIPDRRNRRHIPFQVGRHLAEDDFRRLC